MQTQHMPSSAEQENGIDLAIFGLLLSATDPLAIPEVQREIGDKLAVQDSLDRLVGDGLIHLHDEFVFLTRAATRAGELADL